MDSNDLSDELSKLIKIGNKIITAEWVRQNPKKAEEKTKEFVKGFESKSAYQTFYNQSILAIRALAPSREEEFQSCYIPVKSRKLIDVINYTISDYFMGFALSRNGVEVFNTFEVAMTRVQVQVNILEGIRSSIGSTLSNIQRVLEAHLFDDELAAAEDLRSKGHGRACGALAGVTLEAHLKSVCVFRGISFKKSNPTISDFNEALKAGSVIDVPMWRHIQRMGDIRNLSVHPKDREPTADELVDLISGVKKVLASVF